MAVSPAREARVEPEAQARFLSHLDEIIRPLNDEAQILAAVVEAAGRHLGATRCFVTEVDAEADAIKIHRDFCRGVPSMAGAFSLSEFGRAEVWELIAAGQVYAVADTAADPRTAAFYEASFQPLRIHSVLGVPCMSGGQWVATLSVCDSVPRAWTPGEITLLEAVIAHVWLPLENVRLIARLRRELAEREAAEANLRASEAKYRSLVQATTSLVWTADPRGRFISRQDSWADFTGQDWPAQKGLGWWKMIHPDDRVALGKRWRRAVRTAAIFAGEGRIWCAAQEGYRWFIARAAPVRRAGGSVKEWIGTITDVHDRKQAEAALRASEERLRRLREAGVIGVFSGDETCIRDANDHFLQMLGYSRADLRAGRLLWRGLTPPEWAAQDDVQVPHLLAHGTIQPFEKEYYARDGRRVPVLLGVALVSQEPLSWIAFALDLTETKRAHRELREAKEAAETANTAKDQFLAMLSHELRTPLMPALVSMSALAEDPALPPAMREECDIVRRSIELEARLIDDLLDLTRITKGKLRLSRENLDAHQLLRDAAALARGDAAAKNIALTLDLAAPRSHVHADSARLGQIFGNLINNALKFTPQGGSLRISSRIAEDAPNSIELSFCDNGIGIEPEKLSAIFNAFEQGGDSTTRRFGGLGLGLAISKALAEHHEGSITARSGGRNCGAEFTVRLPLVSAAAAGAPPAQPRGEMRALRILLVEDHEPTALVMARLLGRRGHLVRTAATVREAREQCAREEMDLVISDLGLPDGSGLDLMRELRERHALRGIALSGWGTEHDVQQSLASGFTMHLTKPIDARKLEEAIQRVCAVQS